MPPVAIKAFPEPPDGRPLLQNDVLNQCRPSQASAHGTLWMSMQGRNRAAATGAAWTVDEHCGTSGGRRLMWQRPICACVCYTQALCRLRWRRPSWLGGGGAPPAGSWLYCTDQHAGPRKVQPRWCRGLTYAALQANNAVRSYFSTRVAVCA